MIIARPMYWIWENEVPQIACDAIIEQGLGLCSDLGVVGSERSYDPAIRHSNVAWFKDEKTNWIKGICKFFMEAANQSAWNFEILGQQNPQFTIYEPSMFYEFHSDSSVVEDGMRKLSVVINLNDPASYEGGEFEFEDGTKPKMAQGNVIVFPSFLRHRVTPVTKGVRYSLVNWFTGNQLR